MIITYFLWVVYQEDVLTEVGICIVRWVIYHCIFLLTSFEEVIMIVFVSNWRALFSSELSSMMQHWQIIEVVLYCRGFPLLFARRARALGPRIKDTEVLDVKWCDIYLCTLHSEDLNTDQRWTKISVDIRKGLYNNESNHEYLSINNF